MHDNHFVESSFHWLEDNFCLESEPILVCALTSKNCHSFVLYSHHQDYNLLWNTTVPKFTRCFRKTIPVWMPAVVLCSAAPHQVYHLSKGITSFTHSIPFNRYNVSRMVAVLLIILTNAAQFCFDLNNFIRPDDVGPSWRQSSVADLTSSMVNVFTFVSVWMCIILMRHQ